MKSVRKFLTLALCLVLCLSFVPTVWAANGWNSWPADGTVEDQLVACAVAQVGKKGPDIGLPSTDWCARFIISVAEKVGLAGSVFPSLSWTKKYTNSRGDSYDITYAWALGQALICDFGARVVEESETPKKGDIIVFNGSHIEIITKDNDYNYSVGGNVFPSKTATVTQVYQHTPTNYCADGSGNKYPRSKILIIRPAYTSPDPNLTVTANNAVATAYNNATITGFIHYGNYQPTEWGIDVTTNSSNWDNANVSLSKSNTISSWNDSGTNISVNFGTDVAAANNPLKANTRYYYRFWVKYGNNQFAHSDVKEFTTPKNEPRFSTPSVTKGSGTNNIVLSSTITWPSTAIPVEWGVDIATEYNDSSFQNVDTNFSRDITASLRSQYANGLPVSLNFASETAQTNMLQPGTKYWYRFWVRYQAGNDDRLFAHSDGETSFSTAGSSDTAVTYTIKYNANGGTGVPANQTKTHGTILTLSGTKPTRANSSAGKYTVTLNANGGSVSPASLDAARTTSYTFKNWNTKSDGKGTSYNAGASYTANEAATLYAQWNSSTSTAAVTLPTPTRTGYTFKGWGTSSTASSGVTEKYTPSGNVTLYAVWAANKYTVSYNANGGTGAPANQTKTHGIDLTLSSTKPTRANASAGKYTVTLNANGGSVSPASLDAARTTSYTFKNWNTKSDGKGTSYNAGASYTANDAATLYAQWNSSTSTAAVTLPTPIRTGYTFKGWGTSSTASSGATGKYTPSGNVTLYAVWAANKYTVSYNANGGTGAPANQTKTHGIDLTLSSTKPTRANASAGKYTVTLNANGGSVSLASMDAARTTSYTFKNWNTKSDGKGTSYNAGASYTANEAATLYAQWNSSISTSSVTLPTPTRTGYTFKGWGTSSTATSGVTGNYTPTGNVTLYAVWEANNYTVTYNANGGTGAPDSQSKTFNQALTLSKATPTRDGFSFIGWAETANANSAAYQPGGSFTKNADVTLYAVWIKPDLTLPAALTTIESEAFAGGGFNSVLIPPTVKEIASDAFGDRTDLIILGTNGSFAETFAGEKHFTFVPAA